MSGDPVRRRTKQALTNLPLTAEAYQAWVARNRPPDAGYRLDRLREALPQWIAQASAARQDHEQDDPVRLLIVGCLSWWVEQTAALAALFSGLGHRVDLGYLPFRNWRDPMDAWDLRRQSTYLKQSLAAAEGVFGRYDMSQLETGPLPADLEAQLERLSLLDVQYTLQREALELDRDPEAAQLYALRSQRNRAAAAAALQLIEQHSYQAVVVPNGSILEFGAVLLAARYTAVPVASYEFGEQRERAWIAQDEQVMLQHTDGLWQAAANLDLSDDQQAELEALLAARTGGRTWANFARRWQSAEPAGAAQVRGQLGLASDRPVVLLCTNVLGDSLALNRQLFTEGMADWLLETARFFGSHDRAQLVVRVHPGELIGVGLPSAEILRRALPELPGHVRVVAPDSEINTYDLVEVADVGLVYTTTVGLEMAIAGLPVVVAGRTHYAGKGFTRDPQSLPQYFAELEALLQAPAHARLDDQQVRLARRYAYRFFFDYPFAFPWHLIGFWEDIAQRPVEHVLDPPVLSRYQPALDALLGRPIDWRERIGAEAIRAG